MATFLCKRCGVDFTDKRILVKHLNRKFVCLPIESDIPVEQLKEELSKKDGIPCKLCNRIYKNEKSLKVHKCGARIINKDLEELKLALIKHIKESNENMKESNENSKALQKTIKDLINKPANITNNITNNLNVTLNCFMDCSGKPIEYLLNDSEKMKERLINWIKSKTCVLDYIDEKFYNPEHPENMMIQKGDTDEKIKLFISGRWKQLNNIRASDMIITNVGNDFMIFLEILRELEEEYRKNRKLLKTFENEVMRPLEWGIEVSEDGENLITKTIVKNDKGEYIYLEDELDRDKKLDVTNDVIRHIHNKEV